MKWSDIFRMFDNNNKHILDNLNLSDLELEKNLNLELLDLSSKSSDVITNDILTKQSNEL